MISCRGYARKLIFATLLASFFSPANANALPGQPDLHVSAAARGDVETFPSEGNSTAPIQPLPSGVMYPKTSASLATVDLGWSSLLEAARKVHSEPTEEVEEVLAGEKPDDEVCLRPLIFQIPTLLTPTTPTPQPLPSPSSWRCSRISSLTQSSRNSSRGCRGGEFRRYFIIFEAGF